MSVPTEAEPSASQTTSFTLLVDADPARRNRRAIDVVLLAALAATTALIAVVASSAPEADARTAVALSELLDWASGFWRVVFSATLITAALVVVDVVWHRRWALARDLVAVVVVVGVLGTVLSRLVESDWVAVETGVFSNWGFPELRVAVVVAVFTVAGPELVVPARMLVAWLSALAALGAVVIGAALPSSALGSIALGLTAGILVRVAFGSSEGVPTADAVRRALVELGVGVRELRIAAQQRIGSTEYVGSSESGEPLKVRVLGRDAQDTQRWTRRYRSLAFRDPPRSAPVGRLEQVEHEALATLMAAQAGVATPRVVTAALSTDGDALIVTCEPDVSALEDRPPDSVSDELLGQLWRQVGGLHAAGISHGRLNAANVIVVGDDAVVRSWASATLGAPQPAIDVDTAELLVSCAVLVGSERALRAAVDGVGNEAIEAALPYLQAAALTPHVRDLARKHDIALKELRAEIVKTTGAEEPQIAELRRIRPTDFLVTALVALAAYLVIKQLAQIGFGTIVDELSNADFAWVAVGVVLAQLTFITDALSFRGAVLAPLPLGPCVALESAIKFVNLTMPGSAGRVAINIRFLQRMGVPTSQAVTSGAVDGASETIIQILLVLVTLPFVDIAIDTDRIDISAPSTGTLILIAAVVGIAVAVVAFVPAVHAKVMPGLRSALGSLWQVARNRRKRVELFGGNVATQLLYALTLGAAAQAYGVDLSLGEVLLINTGVSVFAGLIPVPGGVGAAEAGLTAALVAVGVDDSTAFAIAITHRLCTYFLPPIWGSMAMRWLQRKSYI